MLIQINTDRNINGSETYIQKLKGEIEQALHRVSSHITRVEVHLSDENGDKSGRNDKRCVLEVRLEGRPPIAVTHLAETTDQAVAGAVEKAKTSIAHMIDRLRDSHRGSIEPNPEPDVSIQE
jgi:hypothetical protein